MNGFWYFISLIRGLFYRERFENEKWRGYEFLKVTKFIPSPRESAKCVSSPGKIDFESIVKIGEQRKNGMVFRA